MEANTRRRTGVVGALFIIAIVASILGGVMIESVLDAPDYLPVVSVDETQLIIGVLLELLNGIAVVFIAVMLFQVFSRYDETLALGYVAFRVIEAVIVVAAVVSPLTLLALSQDYSTAEAAAPVQSVATTLMTARSLLVGQLLGVFFSLAGLIFYYTLYRSRLLPRFISLWGLLAVVLVFAWNLLELIGVNVSAGMVLGLPIILNELFLGIWLIAKGFSPMAMTSETT